MKAIPTYILIILAQVKNHDDVRYFFAFLLRCLFEKAESVYPGQLSLGLPDKAALEPAPDPPSKPLVAGGGSLLSLFDILYYYK
jgi:hypothetical protein